MLRKSGLVQFSLRALTFLLLLAVTILAVVFLNLNKGSAQMANSSSSGTVQQAATNVTTITGLHVKGNQILNGKGQAIRLVGVNRPGSEYECPASSTIFAGPSDSASIQAMLSWKVNAVRVPLNEDCWLGINGAKTAGTKYQQAIIAYVQLLNSYHLIVILDLHWNAPGTLLATGQKVMADADHTLTFWTSVATTFKTNSSVLFELYNEPEITIKDAQTTNPWSCWLNGCTITHLTASKTSPVLTWQSAGMQQLVNAVRATGATNILVLGGLSAAYDTSQWLAYEPTDPLHNLVAAWHVYRFNPCTNAACWNTMAVSSWNKHFAPVAQQVPIIATEIGEYDCAHGFIDVVMNWLDSQHQSYMAWGWKTASCGGFPSLIKDYSGTPTNFGIGYKNHLATLAANSA